MYTFDLPPFHYGDLCVFEKLTLTLPKNAWTALIGPSGVGKTTLLNTLSQQDHPFALMPQDDPLMPWMTVYDNIIIGDTLRGKKPNTQKTKQMLEDFDFSKHKNAYPHTLSGGMKQRTALMRTLYENADITLLDEPFSKLDIMAKKHAQTMAKKYSHNKSVFFITHDLQDVLTLADHILMLHGSPAKITHLSKEDFHQLSLKQLQEMMVQK